MDFVTFLCWAFVALFVLFMAWAAVTALAIGAWGIMECLNFSRLSKAYLRAIAPLPEAKQRR